jgi:glycosyltransferase involved in cell wall biosynthesis
VCCALRARLYASGTLDSVRPYLLAESSHWYRRVSEQRPRVSVIVPAFNAAQYLPITIASIESQTFRDVEIIVVNDGSTDDTRAVLDSFGDRITVIHQENLGPAAARIAGIARAHGEYIAFCDADDVQLPHRLAAQVALLDQSPKAAVAAGDVSHFVDGKIEIANALRKYWIGPLKKPFEQELEDAFRYWSTCESRNVPVPDRFRQRRVYQGLVPRLVAIMHLCWGGASLYRRSAYEAVGGLDPTVRHYEDWHLAARLSKAYEIVYLDVPVMLYRRHDNQYTRRAGLAAEGYLRVVNDVWRSDDRFYETNHDVVDRALSEAHYQAGLAELSRGRFACAADNFARSLLAHPMQKRAYLYLLEATLKKRVPLLLRE